MQIIKLGAIGSTNDYIKDLAKVRELDNFTAVTAESQTSGRGQRGSTWVSEPGKNLTMSVYYRMKDTSADNLFSLNAATAIAVLDVLKMLEIPDPSLKWPNDIMSGKKKVAGILIENNVKTATHFESVIGIGLNVNQAGFDGLPNAGSLFTQTGQVFDKDEIAAALVKRLKSRLSMLTEDAETIWAIYGESLFRKGVPTVFMLQSGEKFMGIIIKATRNGMLEVQLEDDSSRTFGIKELTMLF